MDKWMRENETRRVDNLGRVTIPKGMRNRYEWKEGTVLDTYSFIDENGKLFVIFGKCEDPVILAAEREKDERKKAKKAAKAEAEAKGKA